MRATGLVLAALLLASRPAAAQAPPAAPPAAPAADAAALDEHLRKWEEAMKKVEALGASLVRVDKDATWGSVQRLTGSAWYMKAGRGPGALNLATLEMTPEGKKDFKEKFICTGTFIYQFLPDQKEIRFYELPKPKPGQVAEDNLLSLLFGMKADDAKRRYDLKLFKEDADYIYVDIAPRSAADRSDFQKARLILNKSNYLPRRLWFEHANRNEVTWDIPNLRTDVQPKREWFDQPRPPAGWKLVPGETRREPVARPAGR